MSPLVCKTINTLVIVRAAFCQIKNIVEERRMKQAATYTEMKQISSCIFYHNFSSFFMLLMTELKAVYRRE